MANKSRAAIESGLNDLLGSVIRSDQRDAGRVSKEPDSEVSPSYDNNTSLPVIEQTDVNTLTHSDNITNGQKDKQTNFNSKTPAKPKTRRATSQQADPTILETRWEEVQAMSETATVTVTLRIPGAFNEWIDEYIHRSWPTKVKKQELVIEALQLLFVRRGRPGEEILETELLPEYKKHGS